MDKNYALSLPNANDFNKLVSEALAHNEISETEWYKINEIYYSKLYISKDNPRAQSGHSGDDFHYVFSHLPILEAIYKDGSLLDVGCANGFLIESLHKWATSIGFDLQVFGLDISEDLITLAKSRLPWWQDRFFIGNALYWKPEYKYDYICVKELSYVPSNRQEAFFQHLIEDYLTDNGRMIFGPYWYETQDSQYKLFQSFGISPSGYIEKTHYKNPNKIRKVLWFDKT